MEKYLITLEYKIHPGDEEIVKILEQLINDSRISLYKVEKEDV